MQKPINDKIQISALQTTVRIVVSLNQRLNELQSAKGWLKGSGPSLQQHQKLPKLWEMNSLNNYSLFCKEHFLLNKERGKFFHGSKTTKGHQALQNRQACMKEIIEPCLDQELNDYEIRILYILYI